MAKRWLILVGFIGVTFAAAAIGGAATSTSVGTWYQELAKPSWNPPRWLFSPVWTSLYLLMAVAAWRVWERVEHPERNRALGWYFAQLGLNALWSILFFGLRRPDWALVEILVLLAAIIATIVRFRRVDRIAGWMLAPYAAWVSFASVLNGTIWWLNR